MTSNGTGPIKKKRNGSFSDCHCIVDLLFTFRDKREPSSRRRQEEKEFTMGPYRNNCHTWCLLLQSGSTYKDGNLLGQKDINQATSHLHVTQWKIVALISVLIPLPSFPSRLHNYYVLLLLAWLCLLSSPSSCMKEDPKVVVHIVSSSLFLTRCTSLQIAASSRWLLDRMDRIPKGWCQFFFFHTNF